MRTAAALRRPRRCRRRRQTTRPARERLAALKTAGHFAGALNKSRAKLGPGSPSWSVLPQNKYPPLPSTTLGDLPECTDAVPAESPLSMVVGPPLSPSAVKLMSPGPPASPPHWGAAARKGSLSKTLANAPATKLAALLAGASAEPSPVDDELEPPFDLAAAEIELASRLRAQRSGSGSDGGEERRQARTADAAEAEAKALFVAVHGSVPGGFAPQALRPAFGPGTPNGVPAPPPTAPAFGPGAINGVPPPPADGVRAAPPPPAFGPGAPNGIPLPPVDGGAPAFGPGTRNGVPPPPGPAAATCFAQATGTAGGRRAAPAGGVRTRMLAVADFTPEEAEEVPFLKGDSVLLHLDEEAPPGWWWATVPSGRYGLVPKTFFVAISLT